MLYSDVSYSSLEGYLIVVVNDYQRQYEQNVIPARCFLKRRNFRVLVGHPLWSWASLFFTGTIITIILALIYTRSSCYVCTPIRLFHVLFFATQNQCIV